MSRSIQLVFLFIFGLFSCDSHCQDEKQPQRFHYEAGAIVRGDTAKKELAFIFTGDQFAEGGEEVRRVLAQNNIPASFFFTGNFYKAQQFADLIAALEKDGHYLGAHSDEHLLYCDWTNRDSLLVTREEFIQDLRKNYERMEGFGVSKKEAQFFLPPYEWYNDSISKWTREEGLQLVNFTRGTLSHADYTTPEMSNYRSSETIYQSILEYEKKNRTGLNGFLLLMHIGAGPEREDKFYSLLGELIADLRSRGYEFKRVDELLE